MKLKLIKSLVIWNGPTEHIWSDEQCPNIGHLRGVMYYSLLKCVKACGEKPGCTAISYNECDNDCECVLRACTQPVPDPASQLDGYKGYYVVKGTIKYCT